METFKEKFNEILKFINEYDYLISIIFSIVTFFIGFFTRKICSALNSFYLNCVLSMKNLPTRVYFPTRYGKVEHSENKTSPIGSYITYEEALIIAELNKFAESLHGKRKELDYLKDNGEKNSCQYNNFIVGGFLSNDYTRQIMQTKFESIKFGCSKKTFETYSNFRNVLFICNHQNPDMRSIRVNNNELFSYDRNCEGYIVLAKLSGKKDFSNKNHGTVHILFGNNAKTTLQAVKCYSDCRKELFWRLWKYRDHYFIIIKCDRNNEPDFSEFHNLTKKVLE